MHVSSLVSFLRATSLPRSEGCMVYTPPRDVSVEIMTDGFVLQNQ